MAVVKIQVQSEGFQQAQAGFDALSRAEQLAITRASGIGNSLRESSKKGKDSLMSLAVTALGVGSGMEIASKAVSILTNSLKAMHDERERGAKLTTESASGLGKLAQLSGGDPKKMRRMIDEAKKTSKETGISLDKAAELQFSLESAGVADQRQSLARLAPVVGSENLNAFAGQAAGLQKAFGAQETGGVANIVNKLFAASEGSPVGAQDIAKAASILAPSARGLAKTSDEETLAALALTTPAAGGSADMAGTQLQAFAKTMAEKGVGGGFVGAAREISGRGMDEAELLKFTGSIESMKGFQNILQVAGEIEKLSKRLSEVDAQTGTAQDFSSGLLGSFMAQPELAAAQERERAARSREINLAEVSGAGQLGRQSAVDRAVMESQSRNGVGLASMATERIAGAAAFAEGELGLGGGSLTRYAPAAGDITASAAKDAAKDAAFTTVLGQPLGQMVNILREIAAAIGPKVTTPKAGLEVDQ
jgi:hypothetical protein